MHALAQTDSRGHNTHTHTPRTSAYNQQKLMSLENCATDENKNMMRLRLRHFTFRFLIFFVALMMTAQILTPA